MRWRRFLAGVAIHPSFHFPELVSKLFKAFFQRRNLRPLLGGDLAQFLDHLVLMGDMRFQRIETGIRVFRVGHAAIFLAETAAAIDIDRVGGHEFAGVGAHEQHHLADFFRRAHAFHRHIVGHTLFQFRR